MAVGTMTGWLDEGALEWHGRPVARTVADATPRARAVLVGVVRNVVAHHAQWVKGPVGTTSRGAAYDAWLDDGTGSIVVRWVGREAVPGVRPGARMRVEGTVAHVRGHVVVLNPLYRFENGPAPEVPTETRVQQDGVAPEGAAQDGSSVS